MTTPPPRLVPWRVPPPASLGDMWDDYITIPERAKPDATPPPPSPGRPRDKGPQRKRRRDDPRDMVFRDYQPPLHPATIAAWACAALALASTGPLQPVAGILAGFGLIAALFATVRIAQLNNLVVGQRTTWVALGTCLLLVILDVAQPRTQWYSELVLRPVGDPSRTMAFDEKVTRGEADMALFLQITACAAAVNEADAVALGNASVNYRVLPQSQYFRAASLARFDPEEIEDTVLANFLFYKPRQLPLDPFADDFNATYGAYVTPTHIIVYSIGPDGQWQINPRQPVEINDTNPAATLAPYTWNPARGPQASGDWILIGNRNEIDRSLNCNEVRELYQKRTRLGR